MQYLKYVISAVKLRKALAANDVVKAKEAAKVLDTAENGMPKLARWYLRPLVLGKQNHKLALITRVRTSLGYEISNEEFMAAIEKVWKEWDR